ncbi:hypothetical protein WBP07_21745 (plasmid) [Novosphingobium sp. BL-8A]|uniref:hypothetical protein n=1 Tax=Novosphingobium sp. BL-8A TaxID=3127639 RepID=UPI0037568FF6
MDDRAKVLDDLRREVGRICDGKGDWQDFTKPKDYRAFTPAPKDSRLNPPSTAGEPGMPSSHPAQRGSFCGWLVRQADRGGFVGGLATAAAADRAFPRDGDVEAARRWLQGARASGDDWEALDDAELDWLAL